MRLSAGVIQNILSGIAAGAAALEGQSILLDLSAYFNAKAFGTYPGEALLDAGRGASLPAPTVGSNGTYTSQATGILYNFPGYTGTGNQDNVLARGQTISLPEDTYFSLSMLITSNAAAATASGNLTLTFSDNTTAVKELRAKTYFQHPNFLRGEIILPYFYTRSNIDWNSTHIHEFSTSLEPGKKLRSITLPNTDGSRAGISVFSISLWKSSAVQVQSVRPTQKQTESGNQVVELTINNPGAECVAGKGLTISLEAPGVTTKETGNIKRLCPGDQKRVNLGVSGTYTGSVTAILSDDSASHNTTFENVEIGLTNYTTSLSSLARHESPDWFNDAKYGIFIHWGPYAVPGWANVTPYENYAEWFWYWTTHREEDTPDCYTYRLKTYGPDWFYDDSFAEYTASAWDPKEWVDLFADAGAKYFVFTSKHHDGFANFDTKETSNRNSLLYGPKRDLIRELFDAAKEHHPTMKRGTYFSLPEWFNPDYGPYGYRGWAGIIAKNPYTGVEEPYTGRVPIDDYLADLQLPQMNILAHDYESDIMWCDVGAANMSAEMASEWWNTARAQGREVTMNARCGLAQTSDFDTPEYETFSSAQLYKWESSMGMDPYSYGYNRATPDEQYMNASTVVTSLVDIVAKNGNFLLDIGPMANGTIPKPEVDALREAGKWIDSHAEAIFNTTFWFVKSEIEEDSVRFTQTNDAFYVLFLQRPAVRDGKVSINAPVPILEGDLVSLLGVEGASNLSWATSGTANEKSLEVSVGEGLLDQDQYTWVFKIKYAV